MRFKRERKTYGGTATEFLGVDCRFCGAPAGVSCQNAEGQTRSAHMRRMEDSRRLASFAATVKPKGEPHGE